MDFHKVDFKTAWLRLNKYIQNHPRTGRKLKKSAKAPKTEPTALSEKQQTERQKYAARLSTDGYIANLICEMRFAHCGERWSPETLQKLGAEGSLGWAGDALAFIYPQGTKYRNWPEKDFYWDCNG